MFLYLFNLKYSIKVSIICNGTLTTYKIRIVRSGRCVQNISVRVGLRVEDMCVFVYFILEKAFLILSRPVSFHCKVYRTSQVVAFSLFP